MPSMLANSSVPSKTSVLATLSSLPFLKTYMQSFWLASLWGQNQDCEESFVILQAWDRRRQQDVVLSGPWHAKERKYPLTIRTFLAAN